MQQTPPPLDMAHILGSFAKWAAIISVFLLSAGLSWMFFTAIAQTAWFPYFAMALTEGGFILWMGAFMLMRHEAFSKSLAMIMVAACMLASFIVAGTELHLLFVGVKTMDVTGVYGAVQTVLELMFGLHLLAAAIEFFHSYFAKPGNSFRTNGNLIPTNRNLIPMYAPGLNPPAYTVEELQQLNTTITGYLDAVQNGGEPANPLDLNQQPQPQYTPMNLPSVGEIAGMVRGAVSSRMKRGKGSTRNGSQAAPVPGQTNGTTSGGTSTNENQTEE